MPANLPIGRKKKQGNYLMNTGMQCFFPFVATDYLNSYWGLF